MANALAEVKPIYRINEIEDAVCAYFEIEARHVLGRLRSPEIVRARHVLFYLCRKFTTRSAAELGRHFDRDHSTVLDGVRRITMDAGERTHARAVEGLLAEGRASLPLASCSCGPSERVAVAEPARVFEGIGMPVLSSWLWPGARI